MHCIPEKAMAKNVLQVMEIQINGVLNWQFSRKSRYASTMRCIFPMNYLSTFHSNAISEESSSSEEDVCANSESNENQELSSAIRNHSKNGNSLLPDRVNLTYKQKDTSQ